MVRAMCGGQVIDKKTDEEQRTMLGLKINCTWVGKSKWRYMVKSVC